VFVRQYNKKHLQLGFTVAPYREQPLQSLYLVDSQILSNDAMKPSSLLVTLALSFEVRQSSKKALDYFQRLFSEIINQENQIKTMITTEKSLLNTSYLFSIEISKTKKHSRLWKSW